VSDAGAQEEEWNEEEPHGLCGRFHSLFRFSNAE
jgi:hypothetical protein